ncbi:hypothetical protein AB0K16_21915 [Nonomuraea jabiensis]|uniref:hypothetical protein n=1 Tax=Nonomuraea jabiensis TaxID=882448 RepID=UPI00343F7494
MSTAMPNFSERVAAGAALLDKKTPGWYQDIDLGILDLYSTDDCILGQVFGDYSGGAAFLGLDIPGQYAHGFDVPHSDAGEIANLEQWVALTACWKAEIRQRVEAENKVGV